MWLLCGLLLVWQSLYTLENSSVQLSKCSFSVLTGSVWSWVNHLDKFKSFYKAISDFICDLRPLGCYVAAGKDDIDVSCFPVDVISTQSEWTCRPFS